MKHLFKIFTVLVLVIASGCSRSYKSFYPFSKCEYIEVISYKSRVNWDTKLLKDYSEYNILEKGRMNVFEKNTIEKIRLNLTQSKELFDILYSTYCSTSEAAACYEPRHSFIFYDNEQKPYAAIEVCLECSSSLETKGIEKIEFCDEKIRKLETFLKSVGIKHFEEE